MQWRAIVPFRGHGERKTRLAGRFAAAERDALALSMLHHVVGVLGDVAAIGEVAVLSSRRPAGWRGPLIQDRAGELNAALEAYAADAGATPLLVLHADLPLLTAADIAVMIAAATHAVAIAPDRHGTGTNALALPCAAAAQFAFGPDSCRRHLELCGVGACLVRRQGLALDLDTIDDMRAAMQAGWRVPVNVPVKQESVPHG